MRPRRPPCSPARRWLTDVLDDIEALDVVRGMSLFAGQRALYMQALGCFVDLYGDGLAAVDRFVAAQPGATREAAGREIHSMGGAAAALGAIELENAAHRIDTMLRGERARQASDDALRAELEAAAYRPGRPGRAPAPGAGPALAARLYLTGIARAAIHGDGRHRVLRRAVDQAIRVGEVDERVAGAIHHAHDAQPLEQDAQALVEHFLLLRQRLHDRHGADLAAGD